MKKLNVLQFICSTGFYGAERWVLALAKHLDPKLVSCDLAVTLEIENDLAIAKQFQFENSKVFQIAMKHKFDFKVVDKLVEIIKEREIDIIHTHGYKSDILGLWAAKKAGIKIVITPHGFSANIDFKLKAFIWLGCQTFRFADRVVPLSNQLMADVRKFGVKEHRLAYVQNGVDLSEVEAQKSLPINIPKYDPTEKRIGFIGQLIGRKQVKHILDIFDDLFERHSNIRLFLLGDGEARSELEAYASTLKSKTNIEFLGFRDDRMEWLQSFDLFAMTSVLEGIPRCLMETLAMGVPVAAYDISGVDQLIEHNETGLLAQLNDKDTLSKHWEELLFDKNKADFISKNAHDFVYKHYSAQRMAEEYTNIFQELLKVNS